LPGSGATHPLLVDETFTTAVSSSGFVSSELKARIQSRSAPFKEGFDLLITPVASTKFDY
jgi:hypothetical protein